MRRVTFLFKYLGATFQYPNPAAGEPYRIHATAPDHHGDVQHQGADPQDVGAAGGDQRQDEAPHPHAFVLRDAARGGREGEALYLS